MLHCYSVFSIYTIREHVLDFWGIRIPPLPGFEPANSNVEGRLKQIESFVPPLCPSSHIEAQSADVNPPSKRRYEARQPQTVPCSSLLSSRITRLRYQSGNFYYAKQLWSVALAKWGNLHSDIHIVIRSLPNLKLNQIYL